MPSGKVHEKITTFGCIATATASLFYFAPTGSLLSAVALTSSFAIGGYYLSPDLDIHSMPFKRWGAFRFLWIPYQKTIKHRGISHTPILGTLSRLLYIGVILAPAIFLFYKLQPLLMLDLIYPVINQAKFIFIGLELSAASHYLADLTDTNILKKYGKRKLRIRTTKTRSENRRQSSRKSGQRKSRTSSSVR